MSLLSWVACYKCYPFLEIVHNCTQRDQKKITCIETSFQSVGERHIFPLNRTIHNSLLSLLTFLLAAYSPEAATFSTSLSRTWAMWPRIENITNPAKKLVKELPIATIIVSLEVKQKTFCLEGKFPINLCTIGVNVSFNGFYCCPYFCFSMGIQETAF